MAATVTPWQAYLESITDLNKWESAILGRIEYDGTREAEQACHLANDIIYLTRRLGIDTTMYKAGTDPAIFGAQRVGEFCGSGHAAPALLETMGSALAGNAAVEVRLRALHGMLRLCRMPGLRSPASSVLA